MAPPLTILISTLNRREILEKTLWYAYETCDIGVEANLWVWDNASSDDTPDFLGTLRGWPGVRCFRSPVGVGIAGSRARMLPAVESPYILTLDDDVWLLNKGWASAVCRVLAGDPTICQVALGPYPTGPSSDFGIAHEKLDRPFFRVPPIQPGPKADVSQPSSRAAPANSEVICVDGEYVTVPTPERGTQLPFSCSAAAAAFRTVDVLPLSRRPTKHPVVDLREAWSFPLQRERGMRESTIVGYGMTHPSPGPLWHLGRCEAYWEERCRFAEEVYGRSAETQRSWLENARKASGWGQALEDPDAALPPFTPEES